MANSPEILRVGDCLFEAEIKELRGDDGQIRPLRSQSADVLAYLAEDAGRTVSKEEIIAAVWEDTFVTDDSLVQCIRDIRLALEDSEHKLVQNFPKKGYRLNASRVEVSTDAPATSFQAEPQSRPHRKGFQALLGVIAAGILITTVAWFVFGKPASIVPADVKPRIAVLPFEDFSAGDDRGYLSDAVAEGIITELARSSLIDVIARNSSFQFRGGDTDVREIGQKLGVHYLLEGSQQKSGNKLRVTVQLIEAAKGTHVWAHTYDQQIGDLFAVQDQIIKTVANRIGLKIERPVPGHDPTGVSAMHLALQGIALIREDFNEEANTEFFELSREAINIDPEAPFGYINLAHAYRNAATFGWNGLDRDTALQEGLAAARKALERAPSDAGVHYVLARLWSEIGENDRAMASYDKAIALNPSASNYLVASTTPLLYQGNTLEAIDRIERAMGIDPFHDDWFHWQMGWALWEIEDCEAAQASMLKMSKIPRGAHRMLAGIYACLGEVEKAQEAYKVFYAEANEPTISEQREEWKDIWTGPGSLDRWLNHMRMAGMKD